jgi:hypothetical protein
MFFSLIDRVIESPNSDNAKKSAPGACSFKSRYDEARISKRQFIGAALQDA